MSTLYQHLKLTKPSEIRVLIISIRFKRIVILIHTNLIYMYSIKLYLFVTSLFQVSTSLYVQSIKCELHTNDIKYCMNSRNNGNIQVKIKLFIYPTIYFKK